MTTSSTDIDTREWTFCVVHERGMHPKGFCSECGGDRNLIQVVPKAARDAIEEECAAWKAKTRESVRAFLTEHPDLRIRQLSDENGVLEAQLDLANTKFLRAIEALKWYADPENNGKQRYRHGEQSEACDIWARTVR
jgi:hypothetical protein